MKVRALPYGFAVKAAGIPKGVCAKGAFIAGPHFLPAQCFALNAEKKGWFKF
jgi:hypothetical protein